MAIVKMKRLRLMLVRSQKEELLRELTRLGCVQVSEMEELQEQESQGLVHRESSEQTALKTRHAALERALEQPLSEEAAASLRQVIAGGGNEAVQ